MPNYWGRTGAPMIQPTKDELRQWLRESRRELADERALRAAAEEKLLDAKRAIGSLVLNGTIAIPVERIGDIVLELGRDAANNIETKLLTAA